MGEVACGKQAGARLCVQPAGHDGGHIYADVDVFEAIRRWYAADQSKGCGCSFAPPRVFGYCESARRVVEIYQGATAEIRWDDD